MNEAKYQALLSNSQEELKQLPQVSAVKRMKRFVREKLMGQLIEPLDYIPWPKGCLLFGLRRAGKTEPLYAYYKTWLQSGRRVYTVDDLLAGEAFFGLYKEAPLSDEQKKDVRMDLYFLMDFLFAHEKDAKGSLPYRPLHKTGHIYADGIGMICPFATEYALCFEDDDALELAMTQVRNFVTYGYDEKTGLFHHAYRYVEGAEPEKLGAPDWGRAMGWVLFGIGRMVELLREQPGVYTDEREELEALLPKLCEGVLKYRVDGLFPSALQKEDAPVDTSASAMILYAVRLLEEDDYRVVFEEGLCALEGFCVDGKVEQAQGECIALGQYGETYGSYPWSVGMSLALFATER